MIDIDINLVYICSYLIKIINARCNYIHCFVYICNRSRIDTASNEKKLFLN